MAEDSMDDRLNRLRKPLEEYEILLDQSRDRPDSDLLTIARSCARFTRDLFDIVIELDYKVGELEKVSRRIDALEARVEQT